MLNGISGAWLRSSITTNEASSTSASAPMPSVWVEVQPAWLASTSA
jgi:hypothetical protein